MYRNFIGFFCVEPATVAAFGGNQKQRSKRKRTSDFWPPHLNWFWKHRQHNYPWKYWHSSLTTHSCAQKWKLVSATMKSKKKTKVLMYHLIWSQLFWVPFCGALYLSQVKWKCLYNTKKERKRPLFFSLVMSFSFIPSGNFKTIILLFIAKLSVIFLNGWKLVENDTKIKEKSLCCQLEFVFITPMIFESFFFPETTKCFGRVSFLNDNLRTSKEKCT